jgi:branched-chain amino acid transport system ATP-binding protein
LANALRTVATEEKVAMLLVEHDVAMVLGISSFVSVLDFGVCIAQGTPDHVRNDAGVRAAYLGDDEAIQGVSADRAATHDRTGDT